MITHNNIILSCNTYKLLQKMKNNPRDWRIGNLQTVADAFGVIWRKPGGSHVIFRHENGQKLSVPSHRPIKPLYIKKFVRLVEKGVGE
jgi:predicted RNA binding protein YcfA (HicA-like mRNA interferase family)